MGKFPETGIVKRNWHCFHVTPIEGSRGLQRVLEGSDRTEGDQPVRTPESLVPSFIKIQAYLAEIGNFR